MKNLKGTILAAALAAAAAAEASLVATADRSTARYHVGETAKFVVTVAPDANVAPTGVVKVVVYDWGDRAACEKAFAYSGKATFEVPVATDRPGFWRCTADVAVGAAKGAVQSEWGVACDPEKIRAATRYGGRSSTGRSRRK